MGFRVRAGFVSVETRVNESGGRAVIDIPRGVELPGDVPNDQIAQLLAYGRIELTEDDPAEVDAAPVPLEEWTVKALKAHANEHGIDLGDAKKKTDIVGVLIAAEDEN